MIATRIWLARPAKLNKAKGFGLRADLFECSKLALTEYLDVSSTAQTLLATEFTILRHEDSSVDSEAEEIVADNKDFQELMRDSYKGIRENVNFRKATVTIGKKSYRILVKDGLSTARPEDVLDFLEFSSRYNKINQLFTISETVKVDSLDCSFFVNEDWDDEVARSCFVKVTSSTGFYKVEASKLNPETIELASVKCHDKLVGTLQELSGFASKILIFPFLTVFEHFPRIPSRDPLFYKSERGRKTSSLWLIPFKIKAGKA